MPVFAAFLTVVLAVSAPGRIDVETTVLNVRSGAGTDRSVVGTLTDDAEIVIECQSWGEDIAGTQRSSPYWDRIGSGRYIADAFVAWAPERPPVPWCATSGPAAATVAASGGLNVRSGPGLDHAVREQLGAGAEVRVLCQSWGSAIDGNSAWAQIGEGRYVAGRYIAWAPERPWLPWCGQQPVVPIPASTAAFVANSVGPAQESQRAQRVPASVTIAQAILESGWGRSTLTRDDHNYFGMKCFGSPGPVALGCRDYGTHECNSSQCWNTRDDFRAYRNPADSYVDHARQLATLTRYQEAMKFAREPDRFAREIHKAGYATSPDYADKLIDIMRVYRLYQYDLPESG